MTAPFILLLAAFLRFYNLSGQSLWADEGNSVALAQRGFIEIAQRTAFDIHPPFYYWLLKIWIFIFGSSEIGLRSLSVVLGVALVYVIGILGTRLFSPRIGLIAAFIAACSPFQVYYSQEVRMYILLTLMGSLTVLVAWLIWQTERPVMWFKSPASLIYILTVAAGLYTHYAYPLILIVVNLVAMIGFWQSRQQVGRLEGWKVASIHNSEPKAPYGQFTIQSQRPPMGNSQFTIYRWLLLQLIPLLLYLPWLPIAWRQVTTWPSEKQSASIGAILEIISTTLLFGLSWPFNAYSLIAVGVLLAGLLLTFNVNRLTLNVILLWLWFLLPVALTLVIFSSAFLKFLLVASPALALLLACAIESITFHTSRPVLKYLMGGTILAVVTTGSALSLYHYYTNPAYARDNYRGIANFIKAVGGPNDAVILEAEGQQDVFNYYYANSTTSEASVYPLPRRRPLDEAATLTELEEIAHKANKIYAVYWATQQADPSGLIEGWLNSHLFKATDQWYGNVRLVSYASPQASAALPLTPVDYQFGPHIRLVGYGLSTAQIRPGDILQVALSWQTDTPLDENYTVFVQVLDSANHLVGQRDAAPLTSSPNWLVNQPVTDAHGLFIEPGTPPGPHRLIVGLYNSQTGQRLPVQGEQDFVELGQVELVQPNPPLPPEAFKMQVVLNQPMGEVTLLGYDLYKLGYRSTPDTPIHPGDPVQLVVYWLAQEPVYRLQDQLFIQVVTNMGETTPVFMSRQPAGTEYPIQAWREGEIVRAQYNFFAENLLSGTYRLALTLNEHNTTSQRFTTLTQPFRIE